jgi:hypothetical protein
MQSSEEQRVESVADLIATHWRSHPNAADSPEGIVWWTPELRAQPQALLIQALALLVQRGVARSKRGFDGNVVYSLVRNP